MIFHYIFRTRFGYSAILFGKGPLPLKRVFLPRLEKEALHRRIKSADMSRPGETGVALDMSRHIQAYFEGDLVETPWERLDLRGFTPLQGAVLKATAEIPYGEVRSYSQIATEIERPRACRFVGTTLSRNPFPVVIPCHRVIKADGSPGQFGGGTDLKKRMLLLEQES
jgi:methylated-DNA-[protein]-cysteine S-methyltransferase